MSDVTDLDIIMSGRWVERPWGSPWEGRPDVLAAADKVTEIGLARGACYGECPVYTVTLNRSGAARFDGEYFVALVGEHDAQVDPDAFADLARAITFLGFQSLDHGYAANVTCHATTSTWVARGHVRKQVSNYGSAGPRALAAIERLIDGLASTLDWRIAPSPTRRRYGVPFITGSALQPGDLPDPADEYPGRWTQRQRPAVEPLPTD